MMNKIINNSKTKNRKNWKIDFGYIFNDPTQKLKIGKLVFHLFQHIAHHSCNMVTFDGQQFF